MISLRRLMQIWSRAGLVANGILSIETGISGPCRDCAGLARFFGYGEQTGFPASGVDISLSGTRCKAPELLDAVLHKIHAASARGMYPARTLAGVA
jgi:hypothetical protein